MLAKSLVAEALKLDKDQQHLPAVTKYLEALVYLNKSLLDLSRQRDVRLGRKDFGNHVRLASNCLTRVCEIHELFHQRTFAQEGGGAAGGGGASGGASAPAAGAGGGRPIENGNKASGGSANIGNGAAGASGAQPPGDVGAAGFSTVGPNDPLAVAINYNRTLLRQYEEVVQRKKRESGQQQQPPSAPTSASIDQALRLERKQLENLYLAKEEKRKTIGQDGAAPAAAAAPSQQTWSPRSKAELQARIRDRSQSENRISVEAAAAAASSDTFVISQWLVKYLKLLATDEDVDMRPSAHCRLPRLEEYFGPQIAGVLTSEERKKQAATIEFMYTEQTHLGKLKVLQKLFKLPLGESQILPGNFVFPYLRMTLMDLLFGNLEEVVQVHSDLNKALKSLTKGRQPINNFGDVMIQFFEDPVAEKFMTTVARFCRHQQYGIEQLELRRKSDERFANFLKEVESLPVCRGLKLGAMLPMEIQRITKYHLMFERILEYETNGSENFQKLQRCYAKAKEIAEFVNAEKRGFESYHKLEELQNRLENVNSIDSVGDGFTFKGRVYVHDGPVFVKFGNINVEVHCVLLEGQLLLLMKSPTDRARLRLTLVQDTRPITGYRFDQPRLSPIIALNAAALRDDKEKTFYIIAGIDGEVQVYHLEVAKELDKAEWYKLISDEIAKAAGIWRRHPSESSSIANIRRSLGAVEYTSDADFDEFSDEEDEMGFNNSEYERHSVELPTNGDDRRHSPNDA